MQTRFRSWLTGLGLISIVACQFDSAATNNTGTTCVIEGVAYNDGHVNPKNACQACILATSSVAWTPTDEGKVCGSPGICHAGACSNGCLIANVYYDQSTPNPNDACSICDIAKSATAWSTNSDGTACGAGKICRTGSCQAGCEIGGTFYAPSALLPNGCQTCQPDKSTTNATPVADDTACGQSGKCFTGRCIEPIVTIPAPQALAVDATSIYFTENSNSVGKAPIGGGKPVQLATVANTFPTGIAVDASFVYWTVNANVYKVPLAGGSASPLASATNAQGITVDGTSVYWTNGGTQFVANGSIMSVPLAGGNPTTLASGLKFPRQIVLSGGNVLFTEFDGGRVSSVPIGGGAPTPLATTQVGAYGIAVDSTSAYFTDFQPGTVMKVPIGGGMVSTLAPKQAHPTNVAVDATSVYWTEDNAVMKQDFGGPAIVIAKTTTPIGLALDANYVYWSGGAIYRVAKK
jgi:hypothetical protein